MFTLLISYFCSIYECTPKKNKSKDYTTNLSKINSRSPLEKADEKRQSLYTGKWREANTNFRVATLHMTTVCPTNRPYVKKKLCYSMRSKKRPGRFNHIALYLTFLCSFYVRLG